MRFSWSQHLQQDAAKGLKACDQAGHRFVPPGDEVYGSSTAMSCPHTCRNIYSMFDRVAALWPFACNCLQHPSRSVL